MRIALIGYGKMGHMIHDIALKRGHEVVAIIDVNNSEDIHSDAFRSADVAIEFTTPQTAEANIRAAWQEGIPVVSGTTGWDVEALRKACPQEAEKMLVWKSNYSIGVNILFELNRYLAQLLKEYPQYHPSITEVHHIHKLDKPSGTAKTLAEAIGQVEIESIREGEVPGTHTITWDSPEDTIRIEHVAKGRQGFALGAVIAAERFM